MSVFALNRTNTVPWKGKWTDFDFPHLIGKHIASDLVGDDMRVVGKDAVQNGAVILSWNKKQQKNK